MAKFYPCPDCGAHLDHGERCDCKKENAADGRTSEQRQEVKKYLFNYIKKEAFCQ